MLEFISAFFIAIWYLFLIWLTIVTLQLFYHKYKLRTDAMYIDNYISALIYEYSKHEDGIALSDVKDLVHEMLDKFTNHTYEFIAKVEGEPVCLTIGATNDIPSHIIYDEEAIYNNILSMCKHNHISARIIEAYISGLILHERCHLRQLDEGKKFRYNLKSLDKKVYAKDPLEIEAFNTQLCITQHFLFGDFSFSRLLAYEFDSLYGRIFNK